VDATHNVRRINCAYFSTRRERILAPYQLEKDDGKGL
jgi:hypothetical protein